LGIPIGVTLEMIVGLWAGKETMKRPMTPEDLRDKGLPFACNNCGAKPTAEDVVRLNGNCDVCGDDIITYTIDTAYLLIRLQANMAISLK